MFDVKKEIEFWTGIMRDHAEFQYTNLSPKETEYIYKTNHFKNLFKILHEEAKKMPEKCSPGEITEAVAKNMNALIQFIQFKKEILTRLMTCSIDLGLPPSFINHMINEAMEYYRVLCLVQGTIPFNKTLENIRLHKVWLPDASGHASALADEFDAVEGELIKTAKDFMKRFDELFKKAFEMYTIYERTGLSDGAVAYFNKEVEEEINKFVCFLENVRELREKCKALGTGVFKPLIPDHMIREEKYYLYRIQRLYK